MNYGLKEMRWNMNIEVDNVTYIITVKDGVLVYKLFDKHDAFQVLLFTCLTLIVASSN